MIVSAIVLSVHDFRENDRLLICYTRQMGKIEILVRSAQRPTSKLAPLSSGLYAVLSLSIETGKNHYHLIGGEVKKYFKNILASYKKTWRIGRLLRIVDEVIKPEKPNRQTFDLLVKFLESFNHQNLNEPEIIIFAFLIKFLSLLGYQPEIKHCLFCHRQPKSGEKIYPTLPKGYDGRRPSYKDEYREGLWFDVAHGGLVCEKCLAEKHSSAILISPTIVEILRQLLYRRFDYLELQKINKPDFRRAKVIINRFFKWHLG